MVAWQLMPSQEYVISYNIQLSPEIIFCLLMVGGLIWDGPCKRAVGDDTKQSTEYLDTRPVSELSTLARHVIRIKVV